jgi:lipoprotein-releasing system permease protein
LLASLWINELLHLIERGVNLARSWTQGRNGAGEEYIHVLDPGYYLETIPVDIAFTDIAVVVGLTVAVSFIAALLPARKAAGMSPLELFRRH